ncbi:hypothetical protein GGR52DRAFT_586266 [Hypoxylon sp. FL1284]|nr:hypothetical protein GGR52DRAFT_586266 [Hypoxylon sp. FL1284]
MSASPHAVSASASNIDHEEKKDPITDLTYGDLVKNNPNVFAGEDVVGQSLSPIYIMLFFRDEQPAEMYDKKISQTGVFFFMSIPIWIEIEILRPVKLLYEQFVSPCGIFRRLVEMCPEELNATKIILTALYGKEDNCLDDEQYKGWDYVNAMRMLQTYEADEWVCDKVTTYFKTYCNRVHLEAGSTSYFSAFSMTRQDEILEEIDISYRLYKGVRLGLFDLPQWAFGYWALRSVDECVLQSRFDQLSTPFQHEILAANDILNEMEDNFEDEDDIRSIIFLDE